MNIELVGTRIFIRQLKKSDAPDVAQYANDTAIVKYTTLPFPYNEENALEFIAHTHTKMRNKESFELGIELLDTKQIIGTIGLMKMDHTNKNAELGYWLGKPYWDQKLMKEAVQLMLTFGFDSLGLERIYARVMIPNTRSIKLLEKCGFVYEGTLRKANLVQEEWIDDVMYALLKQDFKRNG